MGKIYIVGIGPGDHEMMTGEACRALDISDIIVGYKTYIELIRDRYSDKELRASNMREETDRCRECVELARNGHTVALICSGDAGVYGMASPLYEAAYRVYGTEADLTTDDADDIGEEIEIEVIPGVTAALSGAAVLGAPISHDFCVISLSDLLTPWELIRKRLICAAEGDFCMAIYNPASRSRADHLKRACECLLEVLPPDTCCGYVKNIGRDGEESRVCTLRELGSIDADMFTTVFIGNSQTVVLNGKLVTPRGYGIHE